MSRLTIIILSYNTKELLCNCLRSIELQEHAQWKIVVVDNGSTDGSVEMVKKEFPRVTVMQQQKNLGFAAGNNVALRLVDTAYVMLLNSDAELLQGENIDKLVEYMEQYSEVGVVTPKIVLDDGNIDMSCHRGVPTPWSGFTYFSGIEKMIGKLPLLNIVFGRYHQLWKNMDKVHEIDVCSAAAMVVRAKAMQDVGLLDERYFFYAEDIDWCVSFKHKGWRVQYFPAVKVLHHKWKAGMNRKITTKQELEMQKRAKSMFFDTMEEFYRKHYAQTYPRWFMNFVLFGIRTIKKMKGA